LVNQPRLAFFDQNQLPAGSQPQLPACLQQPLQRLLQLLPLLLRYTQPLHQQLKLLLRLDDLLLLLLCSSFGGLCKVVGTGRISRLGPAICGVTLHPWQRRQRCCCCLFPSYGQALQLLLLLLCSSSIRRTPQQRRQLLLLLPSSSSACSCHDSWSAWSAI
jgi:hypothetical protein